MFRRFTVFVRCAAWVGTALLVWLMLDARSWAGDEAGSPPVTRELDGGEPLAVAQESRDDSSAPAPADAEAAFEEVFGRWKQVIMRLRQLKSEYPSTEPAERGRVEKEWEVTVAEGERMLPDLINKVLDAYRAAPNQDRVKTNFLAKVLNDYVTRDLYEPALKIGRVLFENNCDLAEVFRDTGIAAFALNDYELAKELLQRSAEANALTADGVMLREGLDDCLKHWQQEQKLRAAEAAADDLPRVKLATTKGDVIIELFENEAPETVANFISLVKQGFYDGLTFHRVLSGFMAQGGCPVGDGTGGPPYRIYDECAKPGARRHFRGVLSMAKTIAPNSGGSQFFIAFRPLAHLDGQHTVFGRVIEGMDVVTSLQRRDPQEENPPEPDRILAAEILRTRDHEYQPRKVE